MERFYVLKRSVSIKGNSKTSRTMSLEDQFNSLSSSDLDDFIANEQEEHHQLDFKLVNGADLRHRDDRKNLAKSISGFANSSGGLIVWGIDARKNPDGIDCAIGKQEIDPLPLFISRLNTLTGQAVSPIVDGLQHRAISTSGNLGFAVTLVPESISGPHMAKLGEDRYYKRSGDSFYRMEHFDLEDMFGRRKKPKLEIVSRIVGGSLIPGERNATHKRTVMLEIKNVGRGSARAPFLAIAVHEPYGVSQFGIDGQFNFGLPRLARSYGIKEEQYGASADFVIHPGTIHSVTAIEVNVGGEATEVQDVVVDYKLSAEEMRLVEGQLIIEGTQLRSFVANLR